MTPFFEEETADATFVRHAVADFNNDGFPDIVAANGSVLRLYPGNGTFAPSSVVIYDGGGFTTPSVSEVIVADVDDDDQLDVVFTDSNAGKIGILFGNGDLTFTGPFLFTGSGKRLATGDFNGDGRLDIVGIGTNTVELFTQNAEGGFDPAWTYVVSLVTDLVTGDFNQNGKLDIILTGNGGIAFFDGKGDGTFWSPTMTGDGDTAYAIQAMDLDNDGDLDLVTADDASVSVTVWRYDTDTGWTRTKYPILPPSALGARAKGLVLADFNGDGILDIAASGNKAGYIAVLTGNGDATFDDPSYTFVDPEAGVFEATATLQVLTAGDFDADGRIDILGEQARIGVMSFFQNLCGLVDVEAEAPPVVSVGQMLQVQVTVAQAADEAPVPTGTVTLRNGATVLDSETLVRGAATLETSSLPAGDYSLTVSYSGDANYDTAVSDPIPVTVTTTTTSTAVTKNVTQSVWGQPVTFTATVTSTDNTGDPIEGTVELFIDGVLAGSGAAPAFQFTTSTLTVGSHSITARYLGSEDQPPSSISAPTTHTVTKATSDVTLLSTPSYAGGTAIIEARINLPYIADATGTIQLFEGNTLVGTIDAALQPRIFSLNGLSMGTHYFRAVYSGDANVTGDESPVYAHTVLFQSSGLVASGGTSSITVVWGDFPNGATQARLYRAPVNGNFTLINTFNAGTYTYTDPNVSAGTVYQYVVDYVNGSGGLVAETNVDLAQLVTFTND
ncbi:MAG TPA: FG-GAP-like repeat-containing protein, partial [Thermoanaerobaculia bacterium]|nr:FG-GAP-like repeat-containing protein [Thermoanaerobaculia bacterium]